MTRLSAEELVTPLLLIFVVVPLFLVFLQFVYRYVLTYRLTDRSVLIVLFGVVPIFRIRCDSIEQVKRVSFWEATFKYQYVLKLGNRLLGDGVLIRRKRKFPIMVSPDDAEEFVREVRRRVHQ